MSRTRPASWALLVYSCLALLLLSPALLNLDSAAIGSPGADAHKHIWSQWWVWSQLIAGAGIPLETDQIFFPDGGPFFSLDTANALLSAPLRPFLSPLAVYNLLYLFHLVAAAWTCWWLARECGLDRHASLIAGTAGVFCSWVLAFPMGSGVSETMAIFPLPLTWLFGVRMLRQPGRMAPALCATFLLIQAAFCWSYAIIASVGLAAMGLGWLAHQPWKRTAGEPWALDRAALLRLGSSVGLVSLAVLPAYLSVAGTVQADDAIYTRSLSLWPGPGTPNPLELPETNHTPLADFFLPGSAGLRESNEGVEKLLYAAYPGWITLLAFGLALRHGGRQVRYLGFGAALFFLLALGPTIDLDHARTGPHWANPVHLAFYYVFPLFSATIHSTDRLLIGLQIILGIGAGLGLMRWLKTLPEARQSWAAIGISAVMVAELALVSPAPWPIAETPTAPHPASERIAQQQSQGAILDLPFFDTESGQFHGDIFFQQTIHGRPLPFRLDGVREQVVSHSLRENAFYRELEHELLQTPLERGSTCRDAQALGELGFDAIVLRLDRLPPDQGDKLEDLLEHCLGPLEHQANARIAWLTETGT
jgi:hypothetical protein